MLRLKDHEAFAASTLLPQAMRHKVVAMVVWKESWEKELIANLAAIMPL